MEQEWNQLFLLGTDEYMKLIRKKWLHDNATKEHSQRGNGGGLRELSCLDLQKKIVFLPFSTPLCAGKIKKKGESQTMINVKLIEENLWCKILR